MKNLQMVINGRFNSRYLHKPLMAINCLLVMLFLAQQYLNSCYLIKTLFIIQLQVGGMMVNVVHSKPVHLRVKNVLHQLRPSVIQVFSIKSALFYVINRVMKLNAKLQVKFHTRWNVIFVDTQMRMCGSMENISNWNMQEMIPYCLRFKQFMGQVPYKY